MKGITSLGDEIEAFTILAVFIFAFAMFKKSKEAIILSLSTIGVIILSVVLKTLVARPRPDPTLVLQIGEYGKSDSFPSGHVLYAIGLYGFLLFLVFTKLKKGFLRNLLIFALVALLILMGISRIYLGAHWFSDTLGSYLIGSVWLFLMVWIYKRLVKPKAPAAS